ncbi:MAG: twin-arginine translocase TatA/TatE family subunit [Edaphobacter sp.]
MPSFQDSALIFFLALLLFGPKKLPELARQLGKLMGEFRRASNEFRMQMEDELRTSEQADYRKKIAAMETAAPVTPAITDGSENTIAPSLSEYPIEEHPHMQPFSDETAGNVEPVAEPVTEPLPIATSGDLSLMPPSTGLPVASSSISQAFASIPHAPEPDITPAPTPEHTATEAPIHG